MANETPFLCLGGVDIVNNARLCQFMADGIKQEGLICKNCCPCPELKIALGFPNGWNRTDAPWYAPPDGSATGGRDHNDSINFAGLLVTSITGLEPGALSRPVTELAGYGSNIGQGRQASPVVTVTGILIGSTCCAVEYGYKWLRTALRGSCAGAFGCGGDDLVFLDCEPLFSDEDCGPVDYEAELAPYYRTMKGVSLVSGPTRETLPRACPDCYDCGLTQVTFTLSASKPCIFHDPVEVVEAGILDCTNDIECIEWVPNADGAEDCSECPDDSDCSTDPDCVSIVLPPTVPAALNPCVNDCITELTCSFCVDVPATLLPTNGEGTLIVTLDNTNGNRALRKIKLQVWQNPLMRPVDQLSECDVCSELNISYLARGSSLVIDGMNRTSTIQCPGGTDVRANPFIASGTGSPSFSYPDLDACGGNYTVCISVDGPASIGAFINIQAVGREC